MNESICGMVRELIPDAAGARLGRDGLDQVERHVAGCDDCRAELELARWVFAGRPAVPDELLGRITPGPVPVRPSSSRTWWGVCAAAVAALALGIGISSEPGVGDAEVPGYAFEVEEGFVWSSEDGLLAGAPLLEDLSDESLLQLLDELATEGPGGAA